MREYFVRLGLMLAGIAALWACSQTMKSHNEKQQAAWDETLALADNEKLTPKSAVVKTEMPKEEELVLELPYIPKTISEPEDKAGFIAIHFWDNLDFAESRALNVRFMEQNFVDWLSIMPAVMSEDRVKAFQSLFSRAAAVPEVYSLFRGLGDKYLADPQSPMVSSEYYKDYVSASQRRGR